MVVGTVELVEPGTEISAESLRIGGQTGGVVRIEQRVTDLPHGDLYRGRFGNTGVLVTFIDPVLAAQADVRAWLLRNVARAAPIEHRNLLTQYGHVVQGRRLYLVQGNPEGQSARALVQERAARGRTIDREAAQTIVGHVCNALAALHRAMVHGYVTLDTVWISASGRVSLAEPGVGALLGRTRRLERMRSEGRLPQLTPEHLLAPPQLAIGSDVFGVASLLIELLTARPLPEAGTPLSSLGLFGPDDLVLCLERATAPDLGARQPDILTFKAELAESLADGAVIDLRAPGDARSGFADPRMHAGLPSPIDLSHPGVPMPMPAGAMPAGAMPPGAMPAGAMPAGMMPASMMPAGMMPAGMMPAGVMPAGMMPGAIAVPHGSGALPPGFAPMGVVGVPMAGPGGVPTMVPMLVGMPMHAAAATPHAPTRAPRPNMDTDAFAELDRATRRIAASAPTDAVLELTEDVSQSSTRLAADGGRAEASASALRLDIRDVEDAARRLETVDGEHAPEMVERDPSTPPSSESGAFFGSMGDAVAVPGPESHERARRGTIAIDDDDIDEQPRVHGLLRDGRPLGEFTIGQLQAMIRRGEVFATDTLIHPLTQRRVKVVDLHELRSELGRVVGAPPPVVAAPFAEPIAQRPMMTAPVRAGGGTALWIAIAVAGFAGAGVWLWLRASGS